jgi:penicillin-binding protein 2
MIPASRPRLAVLYLVVAALLVTLGYRVWYLQVDRHGTYVALANSDRVRNVIEPSVRGAVFDDTGAPMVDNRSSLVISVDMAKLAQQPDGGAAELHRLARLLRIRPRHLTDETRICTAGVPQPCWPGSPYQPIPVAEHVPDKTALQVLETPGTFPGVVAQVQPVVHYVQPIATAAAQVLGYLQPITAREVRRLGVPVTGISSVDLVGQAGLEKQYDAQLRGRPGQQEVAVNALGRVTQTIRQVQPRVGDNLVTSINARLQRDAESVLAAAIQRTQAQGNAAATTGAAVVMTTTGRIVAMASYPTYNPAVWNHGLPESEFRRLFGSRHSEPILNRATQGEYSPGSTWKVTTTAAAVANGYSLYGLYNCPAAVTIGGRSYANDGNPNEGAMTLREALIQSCDTVYYQLGYDMWLKDDVRADTVTSPHAPVQKMAKMERAWGFGRYTGIDLPGENPGTVPTREWLYYFWKDNAHRGQDWCSRGRADGTYIQRIEYQDCHYGNIWTPGQAAIAAIGQGYVNVTPLQLARAYAALANGGKVYSPRVGEALLSPAGQVVRRIRPPVVGRLPVAASTLAYIRSALAGVVTSGTAAGAFSGFPLHKLCVAGKTGTAQAFGKVATSVFASFAPCGHPRYVVVVLIPDAGYGADVSAPAVRQIWDDIYGLEGHRAALPGGQLPGLPHVNRAGHIVATPRAPRGSR